VAVHGEEAYPSEDLISVSAGMASEASPSAPDGNEPEKAVPARTDDT
jgi:hypothetical protein